MNLKRVINIYNCNELYLYEIIEDFKEAKSQSEKDYIFNSFCLSIWNSENNRRIYKKTIKFNIRKDLLNTDIGKIFDTWSEIEYKYYKSITQNENWNSIIRQKINNIYTRYFDKEVILGKEYMDLIKTPKKLYYKWISGTDTNADTLVYLIDKAIDQSEKVKKKLQMEKMKLSWEEYKKITEKFLYSCFTRCKLIDRYEDKASISKRFDFLTEDHFYVSYINKCLEGEIRKWQKKYYNLPASNRKGYKRCKVCRRIIKNDSKNRQYCPACKKENRKKINRDYYIKTVLNS